MGALPPLLSFLLMVVAGWVHRRQLIVIEFLIAENRVLKDRLRGKRIRFTDAERALLARKAKAVGRKALLALDTIVSPDTLLRWHRRLIAEKWTWVGRRGPGRPGIMRKISDLIVRMARDNPSWGYTRIQGALGNLGHHVGRGTVANVLKRNGIEPSPERKLPPPLDGGGLRWGADTLLHGIEDSVCHSLGIRQDVVVPKSQDAISIPPSRPSPARGEGAAYNKTCAALDTHAIVGRTTFLRAHWKGLAASDFLTVDVWTASGLVTHYLLFVISLADRVVHIAGITTRPNEAWIPQAARNLVDSESAVLLGKRYLILDRDAQLLLPRSGVTGIIE